MRTTTGSEKKANSNAHFKCPYCQQAVDLINAHCSRGHVFESKHGVLRLLKKEFASKLDDYLLKFQASREAEGWAIQDTTIYPRLPYITEKEALGYWKPKQYDLEEIKREIAGIFPLTVLDVGAWNGWLSNRLAEDGHQVTAIDYFIDERDGLGARKYYPHDFMAIQMDLEDLSILPSHFDLIIINRGLPYFSDFSDQIQLLKNCLNPGGKLMITGIAIYSNGKKRAQTLQNYKFEFKKRYGMDLFFRPVKGYLDEKDYEMLFRTGIRLRPYAKLWRSNLKARLIPWFPRFFFGIYHKP